MHVNIEHPAEAKHPRAEASVILDTYDTDTVHNILVSELGEKGKFSRLKDKTQAGILDASCVGYYNKLYDIAKLSEKDPTKAQADYNALKAEFEHVRKDHTLISTGTWTAGVDKKQAANVEKLFEAVNTHIGRRTTDGQNSAITAARVQSAATLAQAQGAYNSHVNSADQAIKVMDSQFNLANSQWDDTMKEPAQQKLKELKDAFEDVKSGPDVAKCAALADKANGIHSFVDREQHARLLEHIATLQIAAANHQALAEEHNKQHKDPLTAEEHTAAAQKHTAEDNHAAAAAAHTAAADVHYDAGDHAAEAASHTAAAASHADAGDHAAAAASHTAAAASHADAGNHTEAAASHTAAAASHTSAGHDAAATAHTTAAAAHTTAATNPAHKDAAVAATHTATTATHTPVVHTPATPAP